MKAEQLQPILLSIEKLKGNWLIPSNAIYIEYDDYKIFFINNKCFGEDNYQEIITNVRLQVQAKSDNYYEIIFDIPDEDGRLAKTMKHLLNREYTRRNRARESKRETFLKKLCGLDGLESVGEWD
jgi:hypothetical protein